ncbi:hypothetical protein DWW82_12290, partial [Clostridium sp. AF17-2]|uniref:hypothetical protein n=1 Tax=unclassified Clostridium TaxID=2614128 RepID=UPI000E81CD0D
RSFSAFFIFSCNTCIVILQNTLLKCQVKLDFSGIALYTGKVVCLYGNECSRMLIIGHKKQKKILEERN